MKNVESDIAVFLEEWTEYTKKLQIFCDAHELLVSQNTDIFNLYSTLEKEYGVSTADLFSASYQLRKKLFALGEQELNIEPIYNWTRLKLQFPNIADINFLTPFSVTIYWHSIPDLMRLYKESGLRESIFVGHDFIENLSFKYPKALEKFISY